MATPASFDALAETIRTHLASGAAARPDSAGDWTLSAIDIAHGDFAVARLNNLPASESRFVTLFRSRDQWQVAGEHAASAAAPRDEKATARAAETTDILRVVADYYSAVVAGEAGPLNRIFTAGWRMWNLRRSGELACEDRETFAQRIDGKPLAGYADDRHVTDVKFIADRLACVRLDKPSTGTVTVFVLARVGTRWAIVEKAWSDGIGE